MVPLASSKYKWCTSELTATFTSRPYSGGTASGTPPAPMITSWSFLEFRVTQGRWLRQPRRGQSESNRKDQSYEEALHRLASGFLNPHQ